MEPVCSCNAPFVQVMETRYLPRPETLWRCSQCGKQEVRTPKYIRELEAEENGN